MQLSYTNSELFDNKADRSRCMDFVVGELIKLGQITNTLKGDMLTNTESNLPRLLGNNQGTANFPTKLIVDASNRQMHRAYELTHHLIMVSTFNVTQDKNNCTPTDVAIYKLGAPALFILLLHHTSKTLLAAKSDLLKYRILLGTGFESLDSEWILDTGKSRSIISNATIVREHLAPQLNHLL